jgi:hypothetical protein
MSRRRLALIAAVTLGMASVSPAGAYDNSAGLVRIEPRPYYGAVVSIENGVRVYRGLPTQQMTIINPDKTPISLSFNRTIEHRTIEGVDGGASIIERDSPMYYGGFPGFGGFVGTNPQFRKRVPGADFGSGPAKRPHHRPSRRPSHH